MLEPSHCASRLVAALLLLLCCGPLLADRARPPCRTDDVVVFYTARAPPLNCVIDSGCDADNNSEADLRLGSRALRFYPYQLTSYACRFEESDVSNSSALFQESIPQFDLVFERPYGISEDFRMFDARLLVCLFDSDLPDELFHLVVQRPHEDAAFKCRVLGKENWFYAVFPGYPTVFCDTERRRELSSSSYWFKLPDIMGEHYWCAFLAFDEVKLADMGTEERLYRSLVRGFPLADTGDLPRFSCSRTDAADEETDFQIRSSEGDTFSCRFLDPGANTTDTTVRRYFGW